MSDREGRTGESEITPRAGLVVSAGLVIPWAEITLHASRSGGPGGQNVNKVATKIEARWDVASSAAIDDETRGTLLERLASRIDSRGRLRITSQRFRTQGANRKAALERLAALIAGALAPVASRRPTRPSRASKTRRLEAKKRRAAQKRERRQRLDDS